MLSKGVADDCIMANGTLDRGRKFQGVSQRMLNRYFDNNSMQLIFLVSVKQCLIYNVVKLPNIKQYIHDFSINLCQCKIPVVKSL